MKKIKVKTNSPNYNCAITKISSIINLDNCDNVKGAIVSGYHVIVSNDVQKDSLGIFFPTEVQLSIEFCKNNNLFRDSKSNIDQSKKGYIENNRRVKALKFRGHKSEGLWMPLTALNYLEFEENIIKETLNENTSFNQIIIDGNVNEICKKYIVEKNIPSIKNKNKNKKLPKISRLIEKQFRFHIDTLQIKKYAHLLTPNMDISISRKYHGTSWVVGNILTKRKLSIIDKILKLFKIKIQETTYDYVYSSRKVIKNKEFKQNKNSFYSVDIWSDINNKIKEIVLPKGITIYGEAVGYLPNSKTFIQSNYDYGCVEGQYKIIVYKITYTNSDGGVFLIPFNQMIDFCSRKGLDTPDLFYYGKVKDLVNINYDNDNWRTEWLNYLHKNETFAMNDINCPVCKNKVPSEGVVIRQENSLNFEAITLKAKNFRFLEKESKDLDKGIIDIES